MVKALDLNKLMANVLRGLTVLAGISLATPAFATNAQVMTLSQQTAKKNWNMGFDLETASNLMTDDSYEREAQTSLQFSAGYRFTKSLKATMVTGIYKEQTGAQNSGFDNSIVSVSHLTPLTKSVNWNKSIAGILPTNRQMQDDTSYQGAVRAATSLIISNLFWDSSLNLGASFTRNFHEWDMSAAGVYNTRQSAGLSMNYTLPLFSQLSLSTSFNYTQGWTYINDTRSKFYMGADLVWDFNAMTSVYLGTSNEGNAFKANGVDSNMDFYNDTTSVVKAGISINI